MGITKTNFIRGIQCPKMLWLDAHKPELQEIPPEVRSRLDGGNAFGDSMMGVFGQFTEVREFYPGTLHPDKPRMAAKTAELIAAGTAVICEAAFMDGDGNYCAVNILRWDDAADRYDMYEVKNTKQISNCMVLDAAFQAYLIRETGLDLGRVFIMSHGSEPYELEEITLTVRKYVTFIEENIDRLRQIKDQQEEVICKMGIHCASPYECWYWSYCKSRSLAENQPA